MHPSDEIRGVKSKRLSKKRIVLGVTGSIAAVDCVRLARELIRHGADVFPVMTPAVTRIIHPDALEFATGHKPIVELTGDAEHVAFCGRVKEPADMLLISPCTSNTISKIAYGIDDTSVTTFATTAIGSGLPIFVVPAMHISMYDHKIIQENILKCKKNGIKFIGPKLVENKAKLASIEGIVAMVTREIGKCDLKNKKILIIGGSTAELLDEVRIITNLSSGKTAVNLAKNAFYRGADVELWYGKSQETVPSFIKTVDFETIEDILKLVQKHDLKIFDTILVCAAISDYIPEKTSGKIPSGKKKLTIKFSPAPKIIPYLRKNAPNAKIVGFKLEENADKIEKKAFQFLNQNNLDWVVANTISGLDSEENQIWIIDKQEKSVYKKGSKNSLADNILNLVK